MVLVFVWIWRHERGGTGYQLQPSQLVGPVWWGGRLPEPGLGRLGVELAVFGVSGFYIRPTVVQTGPFWYLSVGSITCPIQ